MSGWGSLQAILAEARTARQQPDTACPVDGTPLRTAPRGGRHCDFDGWGEGLLRALTPPPLTAPRVAGTDCPIDGTRLLPAPGGGLFCPFDGWRGSAFEAEVAAVGGVVDLYPGVSDPYLPTYTSTY